MVSVRMTRVRRAGVIMPGVTVSGMRVTTAVRMASRVMTARVMRAVAAHAAQRHRNEANGAQRESGQIQIHGLSVSREANKRYDRQACPIHLTLLGTAPDATPGGIVEGADAPT
jgi:hypothetical protein